MNFEDITPETLELRLNSTEHDFVERKSKSDKGGWVRTAVAFANSAPIGWPAVLFVGADDDGHPQLAADGLEDAIKAVSAVLDDNAFPAIYRYVVPLHLPAGSCLAVIIPGSENRPHFAGQSYVRVGSETKASSAEQFEALIAQRNSKVRKILEYAGKLVFLDVVRVSGNGHVSRGRTEWTMAHCNQFFVTLTQQGGASNSVPVEWIDLSFDSQRAALVLITRTFRE